MVPYNISMILDFNTDQTNFSFTNATTNINATELAFREDQPFISIKRYAAAGNNLWYDGIFVWDGTECPPLVVTDPFTTSVSYNATVYEATNESFTLNITVENASVENVTANFTYNESEQYLNIEPTLVYEGNNTTYLFIQNVSLILEEINNTAHNFTWDYTIEFVNTSIKNYSEQNSHDVVWSYYPTIITIANSQIAENQLQQVTCNWTEENGAYSYNYSLEEYINNSNLTFGFNYTGLGIYSYYTPEITDANNTTNYVYCIMHIENYSRNISSTYYNYDFQFGLCDGVNNNQAVTYISYDETTTTFLNTSIEINIHYAWGNGSTTFGYNGTDQYNYTFCATPAFNNFTFNSTSLHSATGYATRPYYFLNQEAEDFETIYIYLLNSTLANDFQVTVYDTNLLEVDDAYVKLNRYHIATESYSLVEVEKTVGGIVHLDVEEDVFYQIIIEYNGQVKKNTTIFQYTGNSVYYTIDLEDDILLGWKYVNGIATSLVWDNDTITFRYTWNAPEGQVNYGCVTVYRQSEIYGDSLVGEDCESSSSATVFVTLPSLVDNVEYLAIGAIDTTTPYSLFPTDEYSLRTSSDHELFGATGLFATVIMVIGMGALFAFEGAMAIIGILLGLVACVLFGIIYLPLSIITTIIVLGCIYIAVVRGR